MLIFTRSLRVCLAVDPVDLRKSFDGLAAQVQHALEEDERSSQVVVFTNKRRDRVRMLYWDGTGLWLLTKRLESGSFNWPKPSAELGSTRKMQLKAEALELLLSGIDLKATRMRPWYEEPSAKT